MKKRIHSLHQLPLAIITFVFFTAAFPSPCKATEVKEVHSILLLIDVSGSMAGAKIDSVKSAAKFIIDMLLPCNTEFSVMGYSGKDDKPVPFQLGFTTNRKRLLTFIDSLKARSNTPLGAALKTASFYFKANKSLLSTRQTIILLGDGRSDDNVVLALKELKEKEALITCECIGFCLLYDKLAEQQLKLIAAETHGEYYDAAEATKVIKAYIKSSLKTMMHNIPVVVLENNQSLNLKPGINNNYGTLTDQNWVVDSIQINVTSDIYSITQLIANENMQDTLPKCLVFDSKNKISLFINNGAKTNAFQKWIEGNYILSKNFLTINFTQHYIKLKIEKIDKRSLVLCVNKYKNNVDSMIDAGEELCDCGNRLTEGRPTILIYCSVPGCGY